MPELRMIPVTGIGEVHPGDDLAATIAGQAPWLVDGDVVVVTSKIVSKAEGHLVTLPPPGPRRDEARDAVLASQTAATVAVRGQTRIVRTHHGLVLAQGGVDASNVDPSKLVLLPVDPDASARSLRAALRVRTGLDLVVIITDTMGRPWRNGLVDVAIGAAGIDPLLDHRGLVDGYGNELHVTITAVADELAAAAELVKGKRDGVPVTVVRGWPQRHRPAGDGPGASVMVRELDQDMFWLGTDEACALGVRLAAGLAADGSLPVAQATAAAQATGAEPSPGSRPTPGSQPTPGAGAVWFERVVAEPALAKLLAMAPAGADEVIVPVAGSSDPLACAAAGAEVYRLRLVLAAEGRAATWLPVEAAQITDLVPLPRGCAPLGILAVAPAR